MACGVRVALERVLWVYEREVIMAKKKTGEILFVQIFEAKANKLFTEEQRKSIRFLRYNRSIACAECGKKKKTLWTMLCQFQATTFGSFSIIESTKAHLPLAPVCQDHPLAPVFDT